ncbi:MULTISPECIES: helix-turn-helix domain-containing protein [Atopobium]|uniref:Helix-turn-helix domain-containing protein n=1 Tax=Atopobium minutum TaxID=1381 RepID=A0AB38A6Q3_9ACTN|nr:helix-turn-helix transcriptional regulator [Atopobium minutum]SEB71793.1 Helix-turn-helix domain-containing protein [Atopobium minutum]
MDTTGEINESQYRRLVGNAIRTARESQKLSLRDLAYMANIDYKYLWRAEHGEANITINVLYRLAKALDISVSSLFRFENTTF